jgi:quercetin 2,3-dioxygenase
MAPLTEIVTMPARHVRKQYRAARDDIGELHTWRPLPNREIDQIDPFLFLNHHGPQIFPPGNRGLPFGPHPHRGFETVTFIVEGSLAHRDTGGHESVIDAGGVQWMTAGRGLEHAEISPDEFLEKGGSLEILQLWVNLPARLKMVEPRYIGLQKEEIPVVTRSASRVGIRLISGTWEKRKGPVESLTDVHMMTIELRPGGRIVLPVAAERNVFLYVVRGEVNVSGFAVQAFNLVDVDGDGDCVELGGLTDALVIFGHARPIGEPVVAHGPFVMNTREEIEEAIRDYHAGKFRGIMAI